MLKQCLRLLKHALQWLTMFYQDLRPCEPISLFPTLSELWARGQEPCEPIFLSLERVLSYKQEPSEPSLSRMWALSWEISSQDPCSGHSAASALERLMLLCLNHFHFHFHANHVNIWSFVKLPGPKLLDIFNVHQDGKLILIPTAMLMCEWSDEQTNRSAECDISVSRLLPNFSGG